MAEMKRNDTVRDDLIREAQDALGHKLSETATVEAGLAVLIGLRRGRYVPVDQLQEHMARVYASGLAHAFQALGHDVERVSVKNGVFTIELVGDETVEVDQVPIPAVFEEAFQETDQ